MISSNDTDVIGSLKSSSDAYVCFIPDEDTFFIVSFKEPGETEYVPTSTKGLVEAPQFFSLSKFKDGVEDSSMFLFGKWTKFKALSFDPTFAAKDDKDQTHAGISDTEVDYDHTYQNLSGTQTTYALQIRRSTLRFSGTYTFPESPDDSKGSKPPTKSQDRVTENGHCIEFK
jgi:hypothetical protein